MTSTERSRAWRAANRERVNAAERKRYHANLKEAREKSRRNVIAWREKYPERAKAACAKWQAANKDRQREYMKKYIAEHPDYVRDHAKKFRERHIESERARARKYGATHREEKRNAARLRNALNPEKARLKQQRRGREHPEERVMRISVFRMIRAADVRKTSRAMAYIGCTPGFLRNHIEGQFRTGMSWDNYGTSWEVDHIVPLSWWDLKNHPEFLFDASHYSNLRPLFSTENHSKCARHCA